MAMEYTIVILPDPPHMHIHTHTKFVLLISTILFLTVQDLVKELIHSKQRLKTTEEELKDVKNYLDNLLLRIMDTNPSLLSAVHTS